MTQSIAPFEFLDQFEAQFSVDGPFSHEATIAAGQLLSAVARYLVYAAGSDQGMPGAGTTGSTLASIVETLARLEEALSRSQHRFSQHVRTPGAYIDNVGPARTLDEVDRQCANAVREARRALSDAGPYLTAAANAANRVGMG